MRTMDDTIRNCLILIPALPLAAAVLVAVLGPRVLRGMQPLAGRPGPGRLVRVQPGPAARSRREQQAQRRRQAASSRSSRSGPGPTSPDAYDLQPNPPAVAASDAGWRELPHRHRPAGRRADGHHAGDGHVRLLARGHLRLRLHARRPRLLAVLRLHRPVRLLDDDARLGQQLRAAVRVLGSGRRLQLPADRLLVSRSPRRPRPARRRFSSIASATSPSRWRCS